MSELTPVLDELDAWMAAERPDLSPRFRPGLSDQEIEDLEARVAPYRLPADLVTLYRWHDGWEESRDGAYVALLPDCSFMGLRNAIETYEMMCGLNSELEDTWNPLWFPAFGNPTGEFVELQPEPGLPAGFLWSFHTHGAEVYTSYDSVTALFRTALALWRDGLLRRDPDQWLEIRRHIADASPAALNPDGRSRLELARSPTLDWPEKWLAAAGIEYPDPADDSEVITIAELLRDPSCKRPVRGEFRTRRASAGWSTGTLTDDTGSVQVQVTGDATENARLLYASFRVEMILTPITDGVTIDDAMAEGEFASEDEEALTRVYLERSAASFDAIHIVPLPG